MTDRIGSRKLATVLDMLQTEQAIQTFVVSTDGGSQ
jgi:hypothetical protein